MRLQVACPACGQLMAVPTPAAGIGGHCAHCQALVPVPVDPPPIIVSPSGQAGPRPADVTPPPRLDEQWHVALPDGQQIGPATWEQFQSAASNGVIPPQALVRRGDWAQPVAFADIQANQQAQALVAAERARLPYGTYSSQLASNPVGTLLFGPKMVPHQPNRDPAVRAARWRHFLCWVAAGAGLIGSHIVLPGLGGLLRLDLTLAAYSALFGLLWVLWPAAFFAIGMFMYAGALFEWGWFYNSKRMRSMRAMWGEGGARGFYLYTGGLLMVGSTLVSTVGNLVIGCVILFTMPVDWQEKGERDRAREQLIADGQPVPPELQPKARPAPKLPPRNILRNLERSLRDLRWRLEHEARIAAPLIREADEAHRKWQADPGNLNLRRESERADEWASGPVHDYLSRRDQFAKEFAELEKFAADNGLPSQVLGENRQLPAELLLDTTAIQPRLEAARAARQSK